MITGLTCLALATYNWTYSAVPGPLDNPLKGWAPFVSEGGTVTLPYSLAYFNVTWKELEPVEGRYEWEKWEKSAWELPGAKGKHIIFRVVMDYPGSPTGVPQWLVDQGVKMTPYSDHGGGLSPDYRDPKLQKALLKFIAALGARYNDNPRVAFLQIGMLGFWGEWHTWPKLEMFADESFQKAVIDGMLKAFPDKKLMARNPSTAAGGYSSIGWHDDMIPQDTLGPDEWMFLPSMKAAGKDGNWKSSPLGGEMVPAQVRDYITKDFHLTKQAISEAHFSWIGPACPALHELDELGLRNAQSAVRQMGYQFALNSVSAVVEDGKVTIKVKGVNQGVAPFYYRWPVELALLDEKGDVTARAGLDWDIRQWLPGSFSEEGAVSLKAGAGRYELALGIIDPWTKKPAVALASQVRSVGGWQVLGKVDLTGATAASQTSND